MHYWEWLDRQEALLGLVRQTGGLTGTGKTNRRPYWDSLDDWLDRQEALLGLVRQTGGLTGTLPTTG